MRFEFIGKNISVTDTMKEKIEKKLSILDKYLLIEEDTLARVVVRVYPDAQKLEVTIPTKVGLLRSEVQENDLYTALDQAVDKLEDQLRRQKTRLEKRHRDSLAQAFIEEEAIREEAEDIPVKTKSIHTDRLDLDEAIMQMELIGHTFLIYEDEESGKISVVYRRNSGGYGLIEVN